MKMMQSVERYHHNQNNGKLKYFKGVARCYTQRRWFEPNLKTDSAEVARTCGRGRKESRFTVDQMENTAGKLCIVEGQQSGNR